MRIAPTRPRKCTGCFTTKLDMPHVDFASAFHGPLIDADNPRAGHVDWLILCQDCIERAHALLPETVDALADLRNQLAQANRELDAERNFASRMEDALQHRPPSRAGKKAPARSRA